MSKFMRALRRDEKGATAIEYGLIAALMSVVVIAAIGALGGPLKETFENIGGTLTSQSATVSKTTPK